MIFSATNFQAAWNLNEFFSYKLPSSVELIGNKTELGGDFGFQAAWNLNEFFSYKLPSCLEPKPIFQDINFQAAWNPNEFFSYKLPSSLELISGCFSTVHFTTTFPTIAELPRWAFYRMYLCQSAFQSSNALSDLHFTLNLACNITLL
jgi:hypothetical protein